MKKIKVFKKYKQIKTLSDGQFVVFRQIKSGRITKFRPDRKLIAEVRNSKTKKIVGYLNTINRKNKRKPKVLPRKFTKLQLAVKTKRPSKRTLRELNSWQIKLSLRSRILDQLEKKGRDILDRVEEVIDEKGFTHLNMKVDTSRLGESFESGDKPYTKKDIPILSKLLGIEIINLLRSEAIRTSPKKYIQDGRIGLERESRSYVIATIQIKGI